MTLDLPTIASHAGVVAAVLGFAMLVLSAVI